MKNGMYTTSEAALKLKTTKTVILGYINRGEIESVQDGNRFYIKQETIQRILDGRKNNARKLAEMIDKKDIQQQIDDFLDEYDEFYTNLRKDCTLEKNELNNFMKYIVSQVKAIYCDLKEIRNDWRTSDDT